MVGGLILFERKSGENDSLRWALGSLGLAFAGGLLIVWFVPCLDQLRWLFIACGVSAGIGVVLTQVAGPDAGRDDPVRVLGVMLTVAGFLGPLLLVYFGRDRQAECFFIRPPG
jgi:drug/metabolite transporter (DMT)-like permease